MTSSHTTERAEGKLQEIGGTLKKKVGQLIGNEQMEVEGKAKEMQGQVRQEAAKAGERVKGAIEEVTGGVEGEVGQLIGNEQMEVEGKASELVGKIRQKVNE